MILRQYTAPPAALPSTSTAATPALPGLVSALRPISRVSSQLSTEALLLRRFTYKNKNQFKGCGWWRKIVHADRIASRVGAELEGLLGEFGLGKDKDDKELRITSEAMVRGLQRLPRSILLLEQTLAVLLNTASILNQLILTRAFLAFAVVVISLVARLHTLTTVLIDDIKNAARVMITLVEGNPDTFPPLKTLLAPLPETLRLVLVARDPLPSLSISLANDTSENNTASPSLPPSTTHSPSPFPYSIPSSVTIQKEDPTDFGTPIARDGGEGDEVGRRVSREELMEFVRSGSGAGASGEEEKGEQAKRKSKAVESVGAGSEGGGRTDEEARKEKKRLKLLAKQREEGGGEVMKKKKKTKEGEEVGKEGEVKKKKKKKKEGDDILALFA